MLPGGRGPLPPASTAVPNWTHGLYSGPLPKPPLCCWDKNKVSVCALPCGTHNPYHNGPLHAPASTLHPSLPHPASRHAEAQASPPQVFHTFSFLSLESAAPRPPFFVQHPVVFWNVASSRKPPGVLPHGRELLAVKTTSHWYSCSHGVLWVQGQALISFVSQHHTLCSVGVA